MAKSEGAVPEESDDIGVIVKMIDLFSGLGGFHYAAEQVWDEVECVLHCEIEPFCQKVLKKHWPDTPIVPDIYDLTAKKIKEFTNGTTVDLLTGGFPCQPSSIAGQRRGTEDDRWLWPEMFRIIQEAKPRWVIVENVCGFLTLNEGVEFENCLSSLENSGYETQAFVIPACAVNAPHRRDRVWIVGNTKYDGCITSKDRKGGRQGKKRNAERQEKICESKRPDTSWFATHASSERCDCGREKKGNIFQDKNRNGASPQQGEQFIESGVGESNCFTAYFKSQQKREQNNEKNAIPSGREAREVPGCGSGGVGTVIPKSNGTGCEKQYLTEKPEKQGFDTGASTSRNVTNPNRINGHNGRLRTSEIPQFKTSGIQWDRHWVDAATELCRLDDGLPEELALRERKTIYRAIKCLGREEAEKTLGIDLRKAEEYVNRADAIKAYGNSIVPQVAVEIMRAIKYAEKSNDRKPKIFATV